MGQRQVRFNIKPTEHHSCRIAKPCFAATLHPQRDYGQTITEHADNPICDRGAIHKANCDDLFCRVLVGWILYAPNARVGRQDWVNFFVFLATLSGSGSFSDCFRFPKYFSDSWPY
ncbi:hypothetical protein RSSM_06752 [Rhodopirellula sallentina SM41]|uniref:Uncharacterized protein n=1 Tax=Rhodopirellula sallentina SM41 TaxID=1263870 RepID=M5TRN1_9BACT|nr:hypothetical protein RSSM_06752 [Rhodopirellula sallentina SM41]